MKTVLYPFIKYKITREQHIIFFVAYVLKKTKSENYRCFPC